MLAILAAIVVPSFEGTTYESKLSSLDTNLASMRTAIDMYYYQHSHYPGGVKSGGTCVAGNNTDTATPGAAAFVGHMTQYTNQTGVACSLPAGSNYGPYLEKIPVNPMTGSNEVIAIHTGDLDLAASGTDDDGGWRYDFISGRIIADQPSFQGR
jgi:type II secretory pathway pseudopilin PulG